MQIRLGTRNSPLAMWQAHEVAALLAGHGHAVEIIPVVSAGDKNLSQPLYALGTTGVFTKDLDIALLNRQIDIAVHSLKDVPTQMPAGLNISACLPRDYHQDVLVRSEHSAGKPLEALSIATSSLRRRAFWKRTFREASFFDIRGNVQTRLEKLNSGLADATLFSLAGLKRLEMDLPYEELPFMLSAPAQGVVAVASREDDLDLNQALRAINHEDTELCTTMERDFLRTMEGGCTAPIGAFAEILGSEVRFLARLCSLDGSEMIEMEKILPKKEATDFGSKVAQEMLQQGGEEMMNQIRYQTRNL